MKYHGTKDSLKIHDKYSKPDTHNRENCAQPWQELLTKYRDNTKIKRDSSSGALADSRTSDGITYDTKWWEYLWHQVMLLPMIPRDGITYDTKWWDNLWYQVMRLPMIPSDGTSYTKWWDLCYQVMGLYWWDQTVTDRNKLH